MRVGLWRYLFHRGNTSSATRTYEKPGLNLPGLSRASFVCVLERPQEGPTWGLFFCSAESDTDRLHHLATRKSIMSRPFIVAGLAIIAVGIVVLLIAVVQSQRHLKAVKKELGSTNEQVVKLEKVIADLKTELDEANKARTQLQGNVSEANTKAEQLGKDLTTAQSQLKEKEADEQELTAQLEKARKEAEEQLATEREASQRQFESLTDEATKKLSESERRVSDLTEQLQSVSAQVEQLRSDRDAARSQAKEATEQANAKVIELENAANQAKDAEAQRAQIQSALDEANKEIERLKQQTIPPVSVSPPEEALPRPEQ